MKSSVTRTFLEPWTKLPETSESSLARTNTGWCYSHARPASVSTSKRPIFTDKLQGTSWNKAHLSNRKHSVTWLVDVHSYTQEMFVWRVAANRTLPNLKLLSSDQEKHSRQRKRGKRWEWGRGICSRLNHKKIGEWLSQPLHLFWDIDGLWQISCARGEGGGGWFMAQVSDINRRKTRQRNSLHILEYRLVR